MPETWTSPVTTWLQSGGRLAFEKDLQSRFESLPEIGALFFPNDACTQSLIEAHRSICDGLGVLDADTFRARRTPFLGMCINRAIERGANGDIDGFRCAFHGALIHVVDAFVDDFDPKILTRLPNPAGLGQLHLPARGEVLALATEAIGEGAAAKRDTGSSPAHSAAALRLTQQLSLKNGPALLLEASPLLFEPEYIQKTYPEVPKPDAFRKLLDHALDFIFLAWPDLKDRFLSDIPYFVPIRQSDATTHNSFSAQAMVGVIFLSESYDDLKIAEAIVHEYHHNELYMYMQLNPLISESGFERLFYSPWRNDARPLFGLLHACYVFTGVVQYMRAVEERAHDPKFSGYFSRMRRLILWRLGIGLSQIQTSDVTSFGQELVGWLHNQLDRHRRDFDNLQFDDLPTEIGDHLATWRRRYPDLSLFLRNLPSFAGSSSH